MRVSEIWRYPVKSLQGERVDAAEVGQFGLLGDRAWSLVDAETGLDLTARRIPELLFAAARVVGREVVITLPDGSEADDDRALSDWLGRPVELRPAEAGAAGTFETQADETETGRWFQWSGPTGSFHDSVQLSLVSVDAIGSWNPRRFRMNVLLDGGDPTGDIELVGNEIAIGSARFEVTKRITRCVMTTRPQPPLGDEPAIERDLDVLSTINRDRDACLGVGALVTTNGSLAVGDRVIVERPDGQALAR